MLELADAGIALAAEQSSDCAGVVAVIDMQDCLLVRREVADGAGSVLLGQHALVIVDGDPVHPLEAGVADLAGIVASPLLAERPVPFWVALACLCDGESAARLALRGPASFGRIASCIELADRLKLAASGAALLCIRAWMRLVALAHVNLVALLAERHKTVSARWMGVKLGSWLKGATDPACFFHAVL